MDEPVNVGRNMDEPVVSENEIIESNNTAKVAFVISIVKCDAATNGLLLDKPTALAESIATIGEIQVRL